MAQVGAGLHDGVNLFECVLGLGLGRRQSLVLNLLGILLCKLPSILNIECVYLSKI